MTDRRLIIDAILYVLKGGIPWRLMPSNFPPWQTVYHVFRQWILDHTWTAVDETLGTCVRLHDGRDAAPTAAVMDSQSVKSDGHGGEFGYDAAKSIKRRKRHIQVDILGLLPGVVMTPANWPEREGGKAVLEKVAGWLGRLRKIRVDGGYSGQSFDHWVRQIHPKAEVEVLGRSEVKDFKLLPKRWDVERTFASLMRQRRLVRD